MATGKKYWCSARGERVGSTLLVLKGSRVREYLQQNQRLLAAPRGQVVRTAFNLTWVSSQIDLSLLEPGLQTLIMFSDHPYGVLCPIRYGSLVAVRRSDEYLDLEVRVEEFVAPWTIAWGGVSGSGRENTIKPEVFGDGGQKVFVQVAPEDTDLPEKGVADEDLEAWRRIVDYLTESEEEREYFRAARFFRPLSLRWIGEEESEQGEDLLVGSGAAFIPGARYRLDLYSYNPHLPEREANSSLLRLGGGGAFAFGTGSGLEPPHLVQNGRVHLEFVPIRQGVHALELSVVPKAEVSSFVRLDGLEVAGDASDPLATTLKSWGRLKPVPDPSVVDLEEVRSRRQGAETLGMSQTSAKRREVSVAALPGGEALRLDDWLAEHADMSEHDRLTLFESFLNSWCDADDVAERYAAIAFREEQWDKVTEALNGREGLSEHAQYLRFLALCEQGKLGNLADIAETLTWASEYEDFFDRFLDVVPRLDLLTRNDLANRLPFCVWGDDKSCRFLRTLMEGECDPSVVSMIIGALEEYQGLFGMDADDVLDWLVKQARSMDSPGPELIHALVDWSVQARHGEEVVELVSGSLLSLLYREEQDHSAVIRTVEELKPALSFPQRFRLETSAADVLLDGAKGTDGSEEVEAAILQLISLLDACLEKGHLWEGEELVNRLRGIIKTRSTMNSDLRQWGNEAVERFKDHLEEWKPYRSNLMDEIQQRALDLGDKFSGRTFHVFTGHQGSDKGTSYKKLEELTSVPVDVHGLAERGALDGLRSEKTVVIVITRWSSHKDTDYVERQCSKKKIPHYLMPQRITSSEGIIKELAERLQ